MAVLKEQVTIKAPRNQVFSYLEDMASRERFMSDNFGAFRLLSAQSKGVSSKIAFGFKLLRNAPSEAELVRAVWPKLLVEKGKFGDYPFTATYNIEETPEGYTLLGLELDYPAPKGLGKLLGRSIRRELTQAYRKALQQLRIILNAHQH